MDIRVEIEYTSQNVADLQVSATNYNRVSLFKGGAYNNSALSSRNDNYKRFILGKSILGEQNYYSGAYGGLWGNTGSSSTLYDTADESKGYKINNTAQKFVITLTGSHIEYFKLVFDTKNNIYAKVIAVNGTLYYNNNIEFECFDVNADTVTIEILALNQSNVPVLISSLLFDTKVTYDKNTGLIDLTRGSQETADNVLPEYCITSQYGKVRLIDYNDVIYNLIGNNKFDRNVNVKIYNGNIVIGTYETASDWDYNVFDKKGAVSLQDRIMEWQEVDVEKKDITYNVSAYQVYEYLKALSPRFVYNVSRETSDFWLSINVPNFYLERDTLWNQWNKFLTLTQSVLYVLPNGEIVIKRRV